MYESSNGGIIDTLNGLLEKGETQLNTATATETTNKNNFDRLKQSLIDEINFANKLVENDQKMLDIDREDLTAFLSNDASYAPQSGAITGILKQMGDTMSASLADATGTEL